jgi:hypothetical protein
MSTSLNPNTSHLASRLAETKQKFKEALSSDEEEDEDEIFAQLEAELEEDSGLGMAALREYGINDLKQE